MDLTLVSAIVGTVIINYFAYSYINTRDIPFTPLNDIMHDALPYLHKYYMNDILTLIPFVFTLFNLTKDQLKKYFLILSLLYTIRAVTICVTHMPRAQEDCNKNNSVFNSCNDLMFSGHTTLTVVSLLALHTYRGLPLYLIIPYYMTTMFFILAPKHHYTVDILIASVLSVSVFFNLK